MRGLRDVLNWSAIINGLAVFLGAFALSILIISAASSVSFADPLKSNNYQFIEQTVGGIGHTSSQSANYQSVQSSGGELGFGNSSSTDFQINAGNSTTNDPALAVYVISPNVNLGNFSPSTTATATTTFQVANYTSYGYVVQTIGTAPTNGTHVITSMSTTGPSQAGVEQFGINLVANTSPISLGANPDQGQFGFGVAAPNYGTANSYRFIPGETIATAPKSSGITTYTISYIVNVNTLTPGGNYQGNQTIVVTGTF